MHNLVKIDLGFHNLSSQAVASSSPTQLSILVVDDEQNMVVELSEALIDSGYSVHSANSAFEALKLLRAHPEIGVMISDIRMPECDGIELTQRAFAERGEVDALEVILITGHGTVNDAAASIRNGTFDLLRKPFRLKDIFESTAQAMARSIARRDAVAGETGGKAQ